MFGRKPAAEVAVTWETGATTSPDEVRIPLTAIGPPRAGAIAAAVVAQDLGVRGPAAHASTVNREIGRTLVLDRFGVRHLEPRKSLYGKFVGVAPPLAFAVLWSDLAHVSLQEQHGTRSPLVMLRLVLWPRLPDVFAGQFPQLAPLRNLPGLGPAAWALSLGVTQGQVDQRVGHAAYDGLARFAGGLFSGQVEQIT